MCCMGFVKIRAKVWNIYDPDRVREVEMIVDTGALYSVLPRSLLEELGVNPVEKRMFRLADGRIIEREVGFIGIEVEGRRTYSPVIFGDEGIYLMGVVTLEGLGLEVDPVTGRLRPTVLLLYFISHEDLLTVP